MFVSRKTKQLLARVNFPPYTVHCLTERHVLVAGGGGSAKTGINNIIEIYELSNNGYGCRARSVGHYETGSRAIMNCAIYNTGHYFLIFAGMEGTCQIFKLQLKMEKTSHTLNGWVDDHVEELPDSQLVLRSKTSLIKEASLCGEETVQTSSNSKGDVHKRNSVDISFDLVPLQSFQTDFSADPFQKLVRFSSDMKVLATAGADGHIRAWKYPEMCKLYEVHAHEDDVDDLDFSPLGYKLVSVSRDGHGKVWNSEDGSFLYELECDILQQSEIKYIFRGCRFAVVEGQKTSPVLFITLNPGVRRKPPSSSFLSKWNGTTFSFEKMVSTGCEMLSAISVSDDGNFVGLGTQEGTVKIYVGFSLQLLYCAAHVHSIFVTGLEFLPASEKAQRISGGHEMSLISISVDNHINIHYIPHRAEIGVLTVVFIFTMILFTIFLLMDYFRL